MTAEQEAANALLCLAQRSPFLSSRASSTASVVKIFVYRDGSAVCVARCRTCGTAGMHEIGPSAGEDPSLWYGGFRDIDIARVPPLQCAGCPLKYKLE